MALAPFGLDLDLQWLLGKIYQVPSSGGSNVPFRQEVLGLFIDLGLETGDSSSFWPE